MNLKTRFLLGWLFPIVLVAIAYTIAFEHELHSSKDTFRGVGYWIIAPYFFSAVGILNLWILALRSQNKAILFLAGLALPLCAFVVLHLPLR